MSDQTGVLVVAESADGALAPISAELAGIGRRLANELGSKLGAVLIGSSVEPLAPKLGELGADVVYLADDGALGEFEGESYARLAEQAIRQADPAIVLLGQTLNGRDVAARLAFRLDTAGVESRAKVLDTVKEVAASGPRLKDAKVVVSGGRGLGGPDNWHAVEELAEPLGAAIGATRAVTDAGWVAPSLQVGLTGVTITPDLYITVAVSGAVQHIAGCSGARNIVAINKDPDANIFKHARYGVVGDWKQVLPAFTAKVKELR